MIITTERFGQGPAPHDPRLVSQKAVTGHH